jgi:phospholipid-binding lipoprotein MlaA
VNFGRFIINSTVGIVGLFDPAANRFEMPREETSLSDTLIQYGTGYGSYLVLPFIGSSNLRDGSASFLDGMLNPLRYMESPESTVVRIFDNFQEFSPAAEAYLTLSDESEDPYIFLRNLHLQGILRDAQRREADDQLH